MAWDGMGWHGMERGGFDVGKGREMWGEWSGEREIVVLCRGVRRDIYVY